jgi:outer membrane receptor protein involved in Fe transport
VLVLIAIDSRRLLRMKTPDQSRSRLSHDFGILSTAFILLVVAVAQMPCQAQSAPQDLAETSLEDLMKIQVYSASKHLQSAKDAPSSVTVITAEEIQKHGFRTLADILRTVRGFYLTYDRNYSYAGVRGLDRPGDFNTRILLLIDGHRLNDNLFDQAMTGTEFPLDLDMIERVEVIRGPVSSLYGANAFFGVINVITKKGGQLGGLEVAAEAASFNTYQARASYGRRLPLLEFLVSGTFYGSRGQNRLFYPEFNASETNNGFALHADDDEVGSLFTTLSFRDFTAQAVWSSREKGIPTASWGSVFNDPRSRTTDAHNYFDLRYDHTFAKDWHLMARTFYDRYVYYGTYPYASVDNPSGVNVNKDSTDGRWWGTEVQLSRTFLARHRVTLGSEYRNNIRQDQSNYDLDPSAIYLLDRRRSYTLAAFGQDEFTITKSLTLNAGFRYDYYSQIQSSTSPRAALIYRPRETTALKFVYGTAFRAPNVYELYYTAFDEIPNPNLRPENIRTFEFVWEQALNRNLGFTTSLYHNKLDHLIGLRTNADGYLQFENVDKANSLGLELELNGKWSTGLEGEISYSLQRTQDGTTHQTLTNSPQNLFKLNLTAPLWQKKAFASVDAQYIGRRKTLAQSHVSGFPLFNLTLLARELGRHTTFSAGVYNLFDRKYFDPGSAEHVQDAIQQDGRSFRLKLTWNWGAD